MLFPWPIFHSWVPAGGLEREIKVKPAACGPTLLQTSYCRLDDTCIHSNYVHLSFSEENHVRKFINFVWCLQNYIYSHHPPICTEYHITAFHKLLQSKKKIKNTDTIPLPLSKTQHSEFLRKQTSAQAGETPYFISSAERLTSNPLPWGPLVSCLTCFSSHLPVSYICTDDITLVL